MDSVEPSVYSGHNLENFIFATNLNDYINEELVYLDNMNKPASAITRERFVIFKQAFDKVLSHFQIYRNILVDIKKEYENYIEMLESKQLKKYQIEIELQKSNAYLVTIKNLEIRKYEFLTKLEKLKEQNEILMKEYNEIMNEKEKLMPKQVDRYNFLNEKEKTADEKENKIIPGLSVERLTDLEYLENLATEVQSKLVELNQSQAKKYCNKQQKSELENLFNEKMKMRDELQYESGKIKNKLYLYKLVMNTTKDYYNNNTKYSSIQEALSKTLLKNYINKQVKEDEDEQNDEGILENESEMILDYIEKFNDLFDNRNFIEAAYFAAAGPNNLLRNMEIMLKFKNIKGENYTEHNDPLLAYCNAILDSIDNVKPTKSMSIECINIALKYNKIDSLTRWIAQRKLTFSYESAKLIEKYAKKFTKNAKNLIELALFIYTDLKSIFEMAVCMAKLGRYSVMMEFALSNKNVFTNKDIFLKILRQCPSIDLANLIIDSLKLNKEESHVLIDEIVAILLESDQAENGLKFLKTQINKYSNQDEKREDLKKLKTSYDSLMKFSFLAIQNDDTFTKEIALESRDHLQNFFLSSKKLVNDNKIPEEEKQD